MGSDFTPFTGPRLNALRMLAFQQDLEARKEQREMNRQKFAMEIDERKRRQAIEDFQTGMALHASGLAPVGANDRTVEAGLDESVGPMNPANRRSQITAPTGQDFYLPTRAEQSQRRVTEAAESGTLKGIQARAAKDVTDPYVSVDTAGGTTQVRESERAKVIEDAYKKANPTLQFHWEDDGQGNTTMIGVDPQGQPKVQKTFQGISKPSAEKMEKPDYEAEVDATSDPGERLRRVDEWMPWAFNKLGIAGDMKNGQFITGYRRQNAAGEWENVPPGEGEAVSASAEDSERARKLAEATVDRAMKTERDRAVAQRKVGRGQAARPDPFARKTSLKIGDKRTVRGKLMTITKVYPDGTFDAQ